MVMIVVIYIAPILGYTYSKELYLKSVDSQLYDCGKSNILDTLHWRAS